MINDDFKTRKQAADILKLSERTLDRYVTLGVIEVVRCGPRRILIPSTEIEKLLLPKRVRQAG
jgi:excisionase family DNA binding protein